MTTGAALLAYSLDNLPHDEEQDLASYGTPAAKELLFRTQIRYAIRLAQKHGGGEDLMQAAMEGLKRAVDKYDGRVKLSTFAHYYVIEAVLREAACAHRWIYVPVRTSAKLRKAGTAPLRESLDLTEEEKKPSDAPTPLEELEQEDLAQFLREAVAGLSPNRADIVRRYYGLGCQAQTFEEIGKDLGMTRAGACKALGLALEDIRWDFKREKLI